MPRLLKLACLTALAASLAACASTPDRVSTATSAAKIAAAKTVATKTTPAPIVELPAETVVMIGGVEMSSNKTIVENASAADNLTTLVALVKQAQLVDTLSGPGPFTVFAPTDDAFAILPAAKRESLLLDQNRAQLQSILKYHVLDSRLTADDLMYNVERNGGSFKTQTIDGETLRFFGSDGKLKIADGRGRVATVTTGDVMQSNGIVHVINSVLMPE